MDNQQYLTIPVKMNPTVLQGIQKRVNFLAGKYAEFDTVIPIYDTLSPDYQEQRLSHLISGAIHNLLHQEFMDLIQKVKCCTL